MINKIGSNNYIAENAKNLGIDPYRYLPFNNAMAASAGNKVEEVSKTRKVEFKNLVAESRQQAGVKSDAFSYFAKATGGTLEKKSQVQKPQLDESPQARISLSDGIHLSREAKDEIKAESSGAAEFFQMRNPLNMTAFTQNLGLNPPAAESSHGNDNLTLAQKLQMISVKTAGQDW